MWSGGHEEEFAKSLRPDVGYIRLHDGYTDEFLPHTSP